MYKIVADADGLIKLGKSGALPALLSAVKVLVPRAVWEEAVEEGKRRMYEDDHVLERTLGAGGAEIFEHVEHEPGEEAEVLLRSSAAALGAGERAALAVFFVGGADAILTDDRAFLGLIAGADPPVPALVPAAAIVSLAEADRLSVEGARESLGKLERSVRESVLAAALGEIDAMEKHQRNTTERPRKDHGREEKRGTMSETRPTKPYPLRVPENLMELAEAKGRTERTDRATALRQLLYAGAEEYVMELLSEGRISSGKAAEILDTSVHRIHELARGHSIEAGADTEDYRRSREATARLLE